MYAGASARSSSQWLGTEALGSPAKVAGAECQPRLAVRAVRPDPLGKMTKVVIPTIQRKMARR